MVQRRKSLYYIPFFTGFLATNNIIYPFVVGNTPILLCSVFAFVSFFYLWAFRISNISFRKNITQDLRLFFGFAFFSIVIVLLYHASYTYQWLVGMIDLLMIYIIIVVTSASFDLREDIYKGLAFGLFVNFLVVIYAYVSYSRGVVLSFQEIFPKAGIRNMYLSNAFRAWGLFKEPGHLMRFISVVSLIVVPYYLKNKKIIGVILAFAVLVITAFTRSSAVAFFCVGLIIFYLMSERTNIQKKIRTLLIILGVVIVFAIIISRTSIGTIVYQSLLFGLNDLFTSGEAGSIRSTGMNSSLLVLKEYPITGTGWGTITRVFMEMGLYTDSVRGTYSYALSLLCQIGIFSAPFYYFLGTKSARLMRYMDDIEAVGIACSLLVFLGLSLVTDFGLEPCSAVVIGLAIGKYREVRSTY